MTQQQQSTNLPARIVVVETVYHQQDTDPPTLSESRFSRFLTSEDSPLIRRSIAKEEWAPLCCAGIETQGSMLLIHNLEGRIQSRVPTEEDRKGLEGKILSIGMAIGNEMTKSGHDVHAFAHIRPGESIRVTPSYLSRYRIKCHIGQARYSLALFPV